ncbi:MAG: PfkB family carbohydrate kinase [Chloroflexota bacterium]
MPAIVPLEPIEYLVIGHLAHDLTPDGPRLGGTAAYAALTARALGLRAGVLTAFGPETPLEALDGIPVAAVPSARSTTFENIQTADGRRQILHHSASPLDLGLVPEAWRRTPILHLGPIAQEVASVLPAGISPVLLGLTPQGWMRRWDAGGHVSPCEWPGADEAARQAGAVVISVEDVGGDEEQVEVLAHASRVLAVTEGAAGCRLYWNGDLRRFRVPKVREIDPTGSGDIFAAAFFIRLYTTRDPWEAARFANRVAAISVTRPGLQGIPTPEEVQASLVEVL